MAAMSERARPRGFAANVAGGGVAGEMFTLNHAIHRETGGTTWFPHAGVIADAELADGDRHA